MDKDEQIKALQAEVERLTGELAAKWPRYNEACRRAEAAEAKAEALQVEVERLEKAYMEEVERAETYFTNLQLLETSNANWMKEVEGLKEDRSFWQEVSVRAGDMAAKERNRAEAAEAEAEALQAEVKRLSFALVEESGEASVLEDEVRKWVDNKRRSDARTEALKDEVERLERQKLALMGMHDGYRGIIEAAEAKAESYRIALKPFARTKALRIFKPPTDEDFRRARQALVAGEAQHV